jgi:hypothetical protein
VREVLESLDNSVWELGYDAFNPYEKSLRYSIGIFFLKCRDLPERYQHLN